MNPASRPSPRSLLDTHPFFRLEKKDTEASSSSLSLDVGGEKKEKERVEEARATTAEARPISREIVHTPKRGNEKKGKAKDSKECTTRAERWGIQPENAQREKEKASRKEKGFGKWTTPEKTGTGRKKAKKKQER